MLTTRIRRSLLALLALGGATHGAFVTAQDAAVAPAPRLPVVSGKDLNGKPWKAPADFPAERTLVILGFEQ